jgi:hypothetical protein
VAYQQSSGSTGYNYGGYRDKAWVTAAHHLAGELLLV